MFAAHFFARNGAAEGKSLSEPRASASGRTPYPAAEVASITPQAVGLPTR